MNAPVREPLWQGRQPVAALWFDAAVRPAPAREQALLQAWRPGAQALRFVAGDLLCLAAAEWMDCSESRGLPLCRVDGLLLSGPLRADERAALAGAELGLIAGAQLYPLRLADGEPLDLSVHLSLDGHALHETFDLTPPRRPAAPALDGKSVRELLGDRIPPRSDASREFVQRLARPGNGPAGRGSGSNASRGPLRRLSDWLHRLGDAPARAPVGPRGTPPAPQAWRAWLTRLALLTRGADLIGWRQGVYLQRLLRQFENDDLDEALRNALPLDGRGESLGQAFGTPGRRADLGLSTRLGPSTSIHLPDAISDHLRQIYRRTFERLDRAGRTDEALFVLAELLNARQEALDYLLRHDRAAQAAELALRWEMPSESIVRLMLLADDTERAIQVARRDDAYAAAVRLLDGDRPGLAALLRREWGRSLVARGEWLAAVDAVWPLPDMRDEATRWLCAAEAAGAEFGARALVQRAIVLPESLPQQMPHLLALTDPAGDAGERSALAEALLAAPRTPALAQMAGLLLPALAADRALGRNALGTRQLDQLRRQAGDACLDADLPPWALPAQREDQPIWNCREPLRLTAPLAGLHAVHDIAPLEARRWLAAFGETGVAEITAAGHLGRRYAVPADALVIAGNGRVALALARRERLTRVSRIDLVTHRISDLGALPLQFHSAEFDGQRWSVVSDGRIQLLDTGNGGLDVLWQVADLPGPVLQADYRGNDETYLLALPPGSEIWRYRGTQRRLVARDPVALDVDKPVLLLPQQLHQPDLERLADGNLQFACTIGGIRYCLTLDLHDLAPAPRCLLRGVDDGVLAQFSAGDRSRFFLFQPRRGRCVLQLDWPSAAVSARWRGRALIFADARGRVLQLDLRDQQVQSFALT